MGTLKRCLGTVGFQYNFIFATCLSFWHTNVDFVATCISGGHSPPWMCLARFDGAHTAVIVVPLALGFVARASQVCLKLTGITEIVYTLLVSAGLYLFLLAFVACRTTLVT